MLSGISELAKQFHDAASDIARAWIEQRFEVSEGDTVEQALVIVHIERPPAAVVTLHAEKPGKPPLTGLFQSLRHALLVVVDKRLIEQADLLVEGLEP